MANLQNTTQGVFDRLPIWAKGIIVLGGAYVLYKVGKNLIGKTSLNENTRDVNQEIQGWSTQFQKDAKKAKPSLSLAGMKSIANSFFTAMDGYQTDEAAIYSGFRQMKNDADYSGVSAAFGKRTISSGYLNPVPNLSNASLIQALNDELDDDEKLTVNSILKKQGITYQI